jgi:hypothetical protein
LQSVRRALSYDIASAATCAPSEGCFRAAVVAHHHPRPDPSNPERAGGHRIGGPGRRQRSESGHSDQLLVGSTEGIVPEIRTIGFEEESA